MPLNRKMSKRETDWREVLDPYDGQIPKSGVEPVEKLGTKKSRKFKKEDICSAKVNIAKFFCRDVEKINGIAECTLDKWDKECASFHIVTRYDVMGMETSTERYYIPLNGKKWTPQTISDGIKEAERVYPSLTVKKINHPYASYEADVLSPDTYFKRLVKLDSNQGDMDVSIL